MGAEDSVFIRSLLVILVIFKKLCTCFTLIRIILIKKKRTLLDDIYVFHSGLVKQYNLD